MTLNEYFENTTGMGVLATADRDGLVNAAMYARPHVIGRGEHRPDHVRPAEPSQSPVQYPCSLPLQGRGGYKGRRLYLTKTKEEKDSPLIRRSGDVLTLKWRVSTQRSPSFWSSSTSIEPCRSSAARNRRRGNYVKEKAKAMVLASFLGTPWRWARTGSTTRSGSPASSAGLRTSSHRGRIPTLHETQRSVSPITAIRPSSCSSRSPPGRPSTWPTSQIAGGSFSPLTRGITTRRRRARSRNFAAGRGPEASASPSNELAGATRIAPLAYLLRDDPEALAAAARVQAAMTHGDPLTIDSAEFFARAACRILGGDAPAMALTAVAGERFAGTPLAGWVKEGMPGKTRRASQSSADSAGTALPPLPSPASSRSAPATKST